MVALFGRTAALATLDLARRTARAGSGRLVLITGEAGIGKSALAQRALEDAAADGFRTARGFAVDDPGAPAPWPWRRIGRDLPEVAEALATPAAQDLRPEEAARFQLCEEISAALSAVAAPSGLALLLEDLHWADTTTVAILRHLALDIVSTRLLLMVTARDTDDTPFGRSWADLSRNPAAVSVPLRGLDAEDVREWLSAADEANEWLSLAPELAARTGGNPFYLTAVATQRRPPPSATAAVDRLVLDRAGLRTILLAPLRGLPAEHRRTVATAAVLAERLSPRSSPPPSDCPPNWSARNWPTRCASDCCISATPGWPFATRSSGTRSSPTCPTTKGWSHTKASPPRWTAWAMNPWSARARGTGTASPGGRPRSAAGIWRRGRPEWPPAIWPTTRPSHSPG